MQVRDDGHWRPIPADPGYRGRGLQLIRTLGRDVTLDTAESGTSVHFTLLAATAPPALTDASHPHPPTPPAQPAELITHRLPGGGLRLQLCGDLDQAALGSIRKILLRHLHAAVETVILDTTEVSYISSAGVALLAEAADTATGRLHVVAAPNGAVARVLALTGLDLILPVRP